MNLTPSALAQAVQCPRARAERWAGPLSAAMQRFGITNGKRAAAFLAQVGHESASLLRVEESLNYSVGRLLEVFGNRICAADAPRFARNPEGLANRVYGGRADLGNGPESCGDGWLFRGRGLIQVTGRANYAEMAVLLGLPLLEEPGLLVEPVHAAASAAAFWRARRCNELADAGEFASITRRINKAMLGQTDRVNRWKLACSALGVRA
ncbi:glycoside hydrolase family 19 protein [Lysobacter arvi]|uniref:Glycoside hydrolase family 19 protein n=1 Tax=Lysobacter arvi TaxID=3038776 RepID=A0ABU1CB35_9GAMM|nr:glycoside hydrolase family 19 protein [Lysobacter arvi]MDR0182403.1 glycoside hydrolase family 19 protein [Lysobacter arvi]